MMTPEEQQAAQAELANTPFMVNVKVPGCPPEKLQASLDELERELCVRTRIYPRWLKERQITATDARERCERHEFAMVMLSAVLAGIRQLPCNDV